MLRIKWETLSLVEVLEWRMESRVASSPSRTAGACFPATRTHFAAVAGTVGKQASDFPFLVSPIAASLVFLEETAGKRVSQFLQFPREIQPGASSDVAVQALLSLQLAALVIFDPCL